MTEQNTTVNQPEQEKFSNLKFYYQKELLGIVPSRRQDLVEIGSNTHTVQFIHNANGASSSQLRFPIQTTVNMINEPTIFAKCDISTTIRFNADKDYAAEVGGDGTVNEGGSLYTGSYASTNQNKWAWSGEGGLCSYFTDAMSPLCYNDILTNESFQVNTPSIVGYPTNLKKALKQFIGEEDLCKYPYLSAMEDDTFSSYICCPEGHPIPYQMMTIPYGYKIGETLDDKNNKFARRNKMMTVSDVKFYTGSVSSTNLLKTVSINGVLIPSSILASAGTDPLVSPIFYGDLYMVVTLDCGWQPLLHPLLKLKNDGSTDPLTNSNTLIYNATVANLDKFVRTSYPTANQSDSFYYPIPNGSRSTNAHPSVEIQSITTTATNWRLAVFQREISPLITKSPISTIPMIIADVPWVRTAINLSGGQTLEVSFDTQKISQIPENLLFTTTSTSSSVNAPDSGFLINGISVNFSKGNSNIFSYDFDRAMLYSLSRKNGLKKEFLLPTTKVKTPFHYALHTATICTAGMINQALIPIASGVGTFGSISQPSIENAHPNKDVFILNFVNDICSMALGATASTFCDALCSIKVRYTTTGVGDVCDCEIYPFYRKNLIINSATNLTVEENKLFLPSDVLEGIKILNSRQITHTNHPQIGGFSLGSVFNSVKSFLSPKIESAMKFAEKMAPHVRNAHDYVKKNNYFDNENLRSFGKALNSVGLNEHLN